MAEFSPALQDVIPRLEQSESSAHLLRRQLLPDPVLKATGVPSPETGSLCGPCEPGVLAESTPRVAGFLFSFLKKVPCKLHLVILEIGIACCIGKLFQAGGLTRHVFLWLLKVGLLDTCVLSFVSISCC